MKLNIGCGFKKEEGWINIDNDPLVYPDNIVNLGVDVLPFEDNTFDEVKASHILEHIGDGYIFLLKEIYRVCKNNATIEIFAPHHRSDWYYDDPTHCRAITVNSFKLFSKKYIEQHIKDYNSSNGLAIKEGINLEIISASQRYSQVWQERSKTIPPEQMAEIENSYYNVIEEIFVKLLVIKDEV